MKKIRINELARELEVKAHEILDRLPELGVTEKKTHSSSVDEDVAVKLRRLFGFAVPEDGTAEAAEAPAAPAAAAEPPASEQAEAVLPPAIESHAAPVELAGHPGSQPEVAPAERAAVRPAHPIRPPL